MKARIILLLTLSTILFILVNRNSQDLRTFILGLLNPLKSNYKEITTEIKDKGKSYLLQKETIDKLRKENRVLRKYLLDHTHYLKQVASIYKELPTLQRLPHKSIALVDTISYVKLNKFDEVLLTLPRHHALREGKVYGLIQGEVAAGTAHLEGKLLYGELLSNPKCRFDVFVGPKRHPGIAEGVDKNLMVVKFIPKWADVKKGDRVETSGLDGIFFGNIPVGIVEKVLVEGSYKSAYITTYADTVHPGLFFLVTDATPYLASYYDQNLSFPGQAYPYAGHKQAKREENLSSVPHVLQTRELEVNPAEFEIPLEEEKIAREKAAKKLTPKKTKQPSPTKKVPVKPVQKKMPPPIPKAPKAPKPAPKKERPSPFDILRSGNF
ncbi:rod shape-determining protein MreC [Nitratifractor sp.]